MTLSDRIAKQIFDLLEKSDGETEIQRNNLAALIGCVPSQINYVITSRFTPENGFVVLSSLRTAYPDFYK
jgi:transcriptional regulator CtsR